MCWSFGPLLATVDVPTASMSGARGESTAYLAYLGSADAAIVWKKSGFLEIKQ